MSDKSRHSADEWERALDLYERDVLKAFERDANPNDTTLLSLVDREPSHPPDSAGDADSKPDAEDDEDDDDDGGTQASRANRNSSHRGADADLISDEETEPEPKRSTTAAAARNSKSKAPTTQSSGVASSRNQKKPRNAEADDDDWDVSAIQETQSSTASTSRHQQSTTNEKRRGGGARGATRTSMRRNVIPETDSELEASQVRGERSGSVDLMDLDDNLPNSSAFARPKKASTRTSSTASAASSSGLGTAPVLSAPLRAAGRKPSTIREEPDTDLIEVPSDDEEEVQSSAPSKTKRTRGRPAAAASASSSRRGQKTQLNSSTFLDDSNSSVSAAPRTSTRMDGARDISRLSFVQPLPGGRPPLTSTQKSSYTSYIQNLVSCNSPLELKNVCSLLKLMHSESRSSPKSNTAKRGGARPAASHRAPSSEDDINRFHLDEQ